MDCNEIRELLESHALGALEPEEHRAVDEHLRGCPECTELAQSYSELAAGLAITFAGVSGQRLPAHLRTRLLTQIETTATVTRQDGSPRAAPNIGRPVNGASPRAARVPSLLIPHNVRSITAMMRVALTALAILLFFTLVWTIRLNGVLARERARLAEFAGLVDQQEIVLEVIDSQETVRRVLLPPVRESSRAYGKVFTRAGMPHVVAMAARLPVPPQGQAYLLWVEHDGQLELAGVMRTNAEGFGLLVFDTDHNDPVYVSVMLTLQPEDMQTPGGPPVLVWRAEN